MLQTLWLPYGRRFLAVGGREKRNSISDKPGGVCFAIQHTNTSMAEDKHGEGESESQTQSDGDAERAVWSDRATLGPEVTHGSCFVTSCRLEVSFARFALCSGSCQR